MSDQEKTFAEIGVQPQIVDALQRVGITSPFPVQAMALPVALTGGDIIGQAKTGTGKTLGFAVPLVQLVAGPGEPGFDEHPAPGSPQALVVVPTRELAVQVAGDIQKAAALRSVRVLTVYGGRAYEPQVKALRQGVEIVVGTPGRLLDLLQKKHLTLAHARRVVLDEADEMLDLGFLPDVEKLLALTPAGRQTMLFSATMPSAVVALARRYMTQPTHIRAADPDDVGATVAATAQFAYRAHSLDKIEMLARILQARGRGLTMVFARTKRTVARVAEELADRGFAAAAIHGDLGQGAREQALRAFRNGKVDVLAATDVAARGIDVDDVTHVVNYACPEDEKVYLHRIGRTARAGNAGTAITFVDWDDLPRWSLIDRTLDLGMCDPVETYSSSPHLYTDLDIPEGTGGILPRAERIRAGLEAEELEDLGETGRRGRRGSGGRGTGGPGAGGRGAGGRGSGGRGGEGRGGERRGESAREQGTSGTGRTRNRRRRRLYEHQEDPSGAPVESGAVATAGPSGANGAARTSGVNGAAEDPAARAAAVPTTGAAGPGGEATDPGRSRRRRRRRRSASRAVGVDAPDQPQQAPREVAPV